MKVLVPALAALFLAGCATTRPSGEPSDAAEAMADRMLVATDATAWERTGAVRFRMPARPTLLWDRERGFVEASYDEDPPRRVLLDLQTRRAVVFRGDEEIAAEAAVADEVYATWANDSFWLLAPLKVRDPGTRRSLVELDGKQQLLVEYASGGVTPGDAYLWELDEAGRPVAWRMWVKILPVGGVRVTWADWTTLPTGAVVARERDWGLGVKVRFPVVEGAATLDELTGGDDPFAPLVAATAK